MLLCRIMLDLVCKGFRMYLLLQGGVNISEGGCGWCSIGEVIMMRLNDMSDFILVFRHTSYYTSEKIQYLKSQSNKMDLSRVRCFSVCNFS